MKTLKNKLKKQGGFTLVEMLTVVAIIAILIAISIPMVMGALDRARAATDAANVRAAKATASIEVLTKPSTDLGIKVYDATKGQLADTATGIADYAKHKTHETKKYIWVTAADGVVYYQWSDSAPGAVDVGTNVDDSAKGIDKWSTSIPTDEFN